MAIDNSIISRVCLHCGIALYVTIDSLYMYVCVYKSHKSAPTTSTTGMRVISVSM